MAISGFLHDLSAIRIFFNTVIELEYFELKRTCLATSDESK